MVCLVCGCRSQGHRCLHCNESFAEVAELVEHQRIKQHFGGHFILEGTVSRARRLPARFRDFEEEASIDKDAGSYELHSAQNNSESDCDSDRDSISDTEIDDTLEPVSSSTAVNRSSSSRITTFFNRRSSTNAPQASPTAFTEPSEDSSPRADQAVVPNWAKSFNIPGITLSYDFKTYICKCQPNTRKSTGGSKSNIRKHRLSGGCTFSATQLRIGEKKPSKPLTKLHLRVLLTDTISDCNLPTAIVENKSFQKLVLHGVGRDHLQMPSRRTVVRILHNDYRSIVEKLKLSIAGSKSRLSVTFDLWTDRRTRGYLGITGHYYDADFTLRSPVLAVKYLSKRWENHNSERIYDSVAEILSDLIGRDWNSRLYCAVTDGAANVSRASQKLGISRRCLQHAVQLLMKHFCSSDYEIATSIACCNYIAKLTKLSQKFQSQVGTFVRGVPTRWNSYINSARSVYEARSKIDAFMHSQHCDGKYAEALDIRVSKLHQGGYQILHDLMVLLQPFCDLTVSEEGDKYPTSSVVVPRLLSIKAHLRNVFTATESGDCQSVKILNCRNVLSWKPTLDKLWDKYVTGFIEDEMFLMATIVDPRNGCGSKLTWSLLKKGIEALKSRLREVFDKKEQGRIAIGNGSNELSNGNAGVQVARSRENALQQTNLPDSVMASAFGASGDSGDNIALRSYHTVDDELKTFFAAVKQKGMESQWETDPMSFYLAPGTNLQLLQEIAADLLAVPAGEGPSERIFSISGRVMSLIQSRMTADHLCEMTFIKKNKKALA